MARTLAATEERAGGCTEFGRARCACAARPDHLLILRKGDHLKRRGLTRGVNKSVEDPASESIATTSFAIVLTRFEVLDDKRLGHC
jgi:hypothetical protein